MKDREIVNIAKEENVIEENINKEENSSKLLNVSLEVIEAKLLKSLQEVQKKNETMLDNWNSSI